MNKIRVFALFFVLVVLQLSSQSIKDVQVSAAAEKFFHAKDIRFIAELRPEYQEEFPDLIFIQNRIGRGFLVATREETFYPVIAYSDEANIDIMPPGVRWYFRWVQDEISEARNKKITSIQFRDTWATFLDEGKLPVQTNLAVAPLLTTRWNQDCYYNELCPEHVDGPCGHCYAGCVATAMAQVMKFHSYPEQGQGSHMYGTNLYPDLSANFGATTYLWDSMPAQLTASNLPVATLLYHCGVSVNMDYGPDGSGSSLSLATEALVTYFKYASYTSYIDRDGIDDGTWAEIMKNELLARRPLVYAGCGNGGCHAFVVDGIDASGKFHVNWGWGGAYDGYYSLSNFKPGGVDFNSNQRMITGLEPAETDMVYCSALQVYTNLTDTIEDGSGAERYGNNTSCSWLIQPPGAGLIYIYFTKLATEKDADEIRIYQGANTNAPLVATISGYELPSQPILVWGNAAYVTFTSDDILRSDGFSFYYTTSFVDLQEYATDKIQVFPNPANSEFFLEIPNELLDNQAKIELFNSLWQKIEEKVVQQTHQMFRIEEAGTYYIRITGPYFSVMKKLVVLN